MLSCFDSKIIITQYFGNEFFVDGRPYYAQYGLKGHNGLDIIPKGKNYNIYNILLGEIILLEYNTLYGNRIGIWNKNKNLVEFHNHLEYINPELFIGQKLEKPNILGKMGNTGKSFGIHNHYAIAEVDQKCRRLNYNNGFLGWINPLPFLE